MYELLNSLLSDKKGDIVFSCFGVWHICYMLVIFGIIAVTVIALHNKSDKAKQRACAISINLAFTLYIGDFFVMPIAYGAIDIERLPFHGCTAMCVMCFLSRHSKLLSRFQAQFTLLGLVTNLIYVIYPGGLSWYLIHPLSYRVIHTLLFHGAMSAYGIFSLSFGEVKLEWRRCCRELILIIAMTLWALLGNTLYNGSVGDYSHVFNWFFVIRDPFYMLPEEIAPFIMPFVMIAIMFVAVLLTYSIYFIMKRLTKSKHTSHTG